MEWRTFQSSAKITAPDATAKMSFSRMITGKGYARLFKRQGYKGPPGQNRSKRFIHRATHRRLTASGAFDDSLCGAAGSAAVVSMFPY
jgi:hypothetical protein